ncbi:MAG: hypothetical protein IJV64_12305 [Oscillospiraceae bacterium]|nr:hypothetical protein [Oscillospiraceae bacterium]
MNEPKKHCNNCFYSYMEQENGGEMQHCRNPIYNSDEYTHEMLTEDWNKGYCRLWTPKDRRNV